MDELEQELKPNARRKTGMKIFNFDIFA
jgi:hypothetical protein